MPLIIKGDVAGSVEALVDIIRSRNPENFELKIIQSGVGAINESDVEMADSSKGMLIYLANLIIMRSLSSNFSTDHWFQCAGK